MDKDYFQRIREGNNEAVFGSITKKLVMQQVYD